MRSRGAYREGLWTLQIPIFRITSRGHLRSYDDNNDSDDVDDDDDNRDGDIDGVLAPNAFTHACMPSNATDID